jgi:hypothetical protein
MRACGLLLPSAVAVALERLELLEIGSAADCRPCVSAEGGGDPTRERPGKREEAGVAKAEVITLLTCEHNSNSCRYNRSPFGYDLGLDAQWTKCCHCW